MARNWDNLSTSYRGRLERAGITREMYQAGVSVTAARGHSRTPERPQRAFTPREQANPRYSGYRMRRSDLLNRTQEHVRDIMVQGVNAGIIERLDLRNVNELLSLARPQMLHAMLNMTLDDYQAMAAFQVPPRGMLQDWFIQYSGDWYNPFWYH